MRNVLFPNLNGIRAIAVLMVIVHHVENIKSILGLDNHFNNSTIILLGELGVTLFFVLSGFLITYLLMLEKHESGSISLFNFYVRRLLRIWPLYFLIVILAFFVLPQISFMSFPHNNFLLYQDFHLKITLFVLFLPNVALLWFPPVPYASQGWSIGVEEQFYLIWPIIIKVCKNSWLPMLTIIIGSSVIKMLISGNLLEFDFGFINSSFLYSFLEMTRIDCMAIGGLAAYSFHKNINIIEKIIYNNLVQISAYLAVLTLILNGTIFEYFHHQIYAILFGIIIMNMACNSKTVLSINNIFFDYLGKISYGLYMYHVICITLTLKTFAHFGSLGLLDSPISGFLIYSTSIIITVIISALSYELLEKIFITKKLGFSYVRSGENARQEAQCLFAITQIYYKFHEFCFNLKRRRSKPF